jgi:simple sugar transport system permease protein
MKHFGDVASKLLQARAFGAVAAMVILAAVFQALSGNFLTPSEFSGIAQVAAPLGIMAVGVAFLMVSGEFDLSVGAMYVFVPILMGELLTKLHWGVWPSFLAVLTIAAIIGLGNGMITTRFGIPSFIATLGTYFILTGVTFMVTGGYSIDYFHPNALFALLGGTIGTEGLTVPFLWMLVIGVVFWFLLNHTRYGNWTFAAGARTGVSRALGVPVRRVKTINFCLCAMLAGFAGCTTFANLSSAQPSEGSSDTLLAIVAAVLGGTSLFGVEGSIGGTVFGALVLGALETGLVLVGAPGTLYEAMIGGILIVAVIMSVRFVSVGSFLGRLGATR